MFPVFAEIADKMLTPLGLWAWGLTIAVVFFFIVTWRRLAVLLLFPLALLFPWIAIHEAFLEGPFSEAVHDELGPQWIANSIASATLPALAIIGAFVFRFVNPSRKRDALTRSTDNTGEKK